MVRVSIIPSNLCQPNCALLTSHFLALIMIIKLNDLSKIAGIPSPPYTIYLPRVFSDAIITAPLVPA
jgi:hypothetical protein